MNTRYRHREQVTREMASTRQALGRLMSMLRVCLQYAYSMPRVCLEYASSLFRYAAVLLLMLVGVGEIWGDNITSLSQITATNGNYVIIEDITYSSTNKPNVTDFSGTLEAAINPETHMPYRIKNLSAPLFTTLTGTVRNLVLEDVGISDHSGNTGAIACEASGDARIYNVGILSGSVGGTGYTGGLVGLLNNTETGGARVINCYSFADIDGGTVRAGIVGYNSYASKSSSITGGAIKTMVMNCMFYGDISTGNSIYPIYGGLEISNEGSNNANDGRLNNYNYFRYESPFSKNNTTSNPIITGYNRALPAEERYLKRFEFYRYLLNSNRELAAAYIGDTPTETGTGDNLVKRYHKEKMAKWVLDKSIAPYPILKEQGTYPSVVNYAPSDVMIDANNEHRNEGRKMGTLTVNITAANTWTNAPTGAAIKEGKSQLTLTRTDKDPANYNFNYDKIQLPYYNEVGTGNYTSNKVVTGWKVKTSSKAKSFGTTNYDYPNYNLADRSCTEGRVYSQGAYFDVPEDASSISIEPYWGNAVYVSDGYHDSYSNDDNYTRADLSDFGKKYVSGQSYYINPNDNSDANKQKVYTGIGTALGKLTTITDPTVYDYAVVLVGNFHCVGTPSGGDIPFTIMSADLDHDNEPDYSLIIRSGKNDYFSPIRFDFINAPGVVMAHKKTSTTQMGIIGNSKPKGWFEVTNTTVIRFSQMEYDYGSKALSPLILLGGVVEQFVSTNANNNLNEASHTKYIHVGSNVWFKLFNNGCHMDKTNVATPHRPISVTGGEYEKFYLSGYFQPNAPVSTNAADKNAECYIDGGKFGEVAGAGQEKIDGNITWDIKNADIESFFGGGINDAKPVTGNISVTIKNSHVGLYCGGPKFGNMTGVDTPNNSNDDKTVSTTAEGCTFGNFYGAGYGGTAIYRDIWSPGNDKGHNRYGAVNYDWMTWLNDNRGYSDGTYKTRGQYVSGKGIAVGFETEQFEGSTTNTVARLYVKFATLSVAKTNGVISNLTGCTINQHFYGGGNLGAVNGNITSTLNNCTVNGSAFGAGCSATVPTVYVYDSPTVSNFTGTKYNTNTGIFEPTVYPDSVKYTWSNTEGANTAGNTLVEKAIEGSTEKNYWIHVDYDANTGTGINVNDLGTVTGDVTLNIDGNTVVMGKIVNKDEEGNFTSYGAQTGGVFGGGDSSSVTGDTEVKIDASSQKNTSGYNVYNVFGGGNKAPVTGNSKVTLKNNSVINNNVFGGGNEAPVTGSTTVNIEQ